jgi:phosphatidylserine/phosphatidylglycerophosphate/cardiolipin synthase-like enzyme
MTQSHPKPDITLLSKSDYYSHLVASIDSTEAGDRVFVISMSFVPDIAEVQGLIDSLCNASRRGASVHLAIDAYNFLINPANEHLGPLFFSNKIAAIAPGIYRRLKKIRAELENAGATVSITNQPEHKFRNPFSGRSHIKAAVIKNTIYLGGCNLDKAQNIDLMAVFEDAAAANWLYDTLSAAAKSKSIRKSLEYEDKKFQLDTKSTLLIDAGVKKQSTIYTQALDFIDEAKEWIVITCQFFPPGETADHLLAAHKRGVKVKILYNHPIKIPGIQNKALQSLVRTREKLRLPSTLFDHELPQSNNFLHAKILASEQGGIIGSHNYVKVGVQFGTAEIALHTRDPEFGKQLVENIEKQITS